MTYSINAQTVFGNVRTETVDLATGVVPITGYVTDASQQVADNNTGPALTITIRGTWVAPTLALLMSSYIDFWINLSSPSISLANKLQTSYVNYVSDLLNPGGTPTIKVKIQSVNFSIVGGEVFTADYTIVLLYGGT